MFLRESCYSVHEKTKGRWGGTGKAVFMEGLNMVLIVVFWILLLGAGVRYSREMAPTALNRENTAALRGICAVEIMMGHLGIATGALVLYPNRKAGVLFVGVFFAISGYGLMYSLSCKENYLDAFLRKRLLKLLVPAYGVFAVGVLVRSCQKENMGELGNLLNPERFFNGTNWYVWELAGMYLVFYLWAKFCRNYEKGHWILLGLSVLFTAAAFWLQLDNPWYGSTLCFWLGIVYYIKKDRFEQIFVCRRAFLKSAVCTLVMIASIGIFFYVGGVVGNLAARNMASLLFVVVLLTALYRFKLGNRVSLWLGKYSYEIFLFHPLFISFFRDWIANDVIYCLAVMGASVLASVLYQICAGLPRTFPAFFRL